MPEHAELTSSIVIAMIVSEAIELAKRVKWIPLDCNTETATRIVSAVAAFLTGLGLSFQFDPMAGRLVIDGLIWTSISHAAQQWAWQMGYWRLAIHRGPQTPTTALIVDTGAIPRDVGPRPPIQER